MHPSRPNPTGNPRRQRGAVLITSMVLLLIMTMLGITTMNMANLEEQMAANASYQNRAFQAAESILERALAQVGLATVSGITDGDSFSVAPSGLGSGLGGSASVQYVDQVTAMGSQLNEGTTYNANLGCSLMGCSHMLRVTATGTLSTGGQTLSRVQITAGAQFQ